MTTDEHQQVVQACRASVARDLERFAASGQRALALASAPPEPPRILVVDDEPAWATTLRRVLSGAIVIDATGDFEVALERALTGRFDAVLVDYCLPGTGRTGVEFIEAMRAGGCRTPVALMSGVASEVQLAFAACQVGVVAFEKSGDLQALHAVVKGLLA